MSAGKLFRCADLVLHYRWINGISVNHIHIHYILIANLQVYKDQPGALCISRALTGIAGNGIFHMLDALLNAQSTVSKH